MRGDIKHTELFALRVQMALAVLIFAAVCTSVIGHIALGHISTWLGYLACVPFMALTWALVRIAWKELNDSKPEERLWGQSR